jgi:predicted nucleic acid-binding protein
MDTDTIVAAMRSPAGASAALLVAARQRRVILLASVALCLEYEAVCRRPEHVAASGLTQAEVGVFLDAVIALAEEVRPRVIWRPQLRDPDDELVLEAAVNGQAHAIATFNRRDFARGSARFGIVAERPADLLRRLSA